MKIKEVAKGLYPYISLFILYLILINYFENDGVKRVACFVIGILIGKDIFKKS